MALGPTPAPRRRRSPPPREESARTNVRPLDDVTTEVVRVIEFLWPAGDSSVQPVLWVQRELLN